MQKIIFTLLMIVLYLNLFAQSKKELIETREIIQNKIDFLISQLDSINKAIISLDVKESEAKSIKLSCIVIKDTYLSSKPDFSGIKVIDVVENDTVVLIDVTQSGYLYVTFRGQKGYLLKSEVQQMPEFQKIVDIKKANYENISLKEDSIQLDSIRKQFRIKQQQYIQEFGQELGILIYQKKVKIGMTAEMCIMAWGKPLDINRTIGNWGTHEQWVYDNGCYLYFENGILTTIQN